MDPTFYIVLGETHLKAKPAFMKKRAAQCKVINEVFKSKKYLDFSKVPVFLMGDFNEEPQNEPIKDIICKDW